MWFGACLALWWLYSILPPGFQIFSNFLEKCWQRALFLCLFQLSFIGGSKGKGLCLVIARVRFVRFVR